MKVLPIAMITASLLLGCKLSRVTDSKAKRDSDNTDRGVVSLHQFKDEYTYGSGEEAVRVRLVIQYKFVGSTMVEIRAKNVANEGTAEVIKMSPTSEQDTYQGKNKDGNIFTFYDGGELSTSRFTIRGKDGKLLERTDRRRKHLKKQLWEKHATTKVTDMRAGAFTDSESEALANLCKFKNGRKSLLTTAGGTFYFYATTARHGEQGEDCYFGMIFPKENHAKIKQCLQDCYADKNGIHFKVAPILPNYSLSCRDDIHVAKIEYQQDGLKITTKHDDGLIDVTYTFDCVW